LVFLDEAGFSLSLSLPYGWGKRGEPLVETVHKCVNVVPARRGKNLSVLGAIDVEGVVAHTSKEGAMTRKEGAMTRKEGAMTRADVERFFRRDLLPRLLPGAVLVLDNASIRVHTLVNHKGGQVERLTRRAGCRVMYLPPYSPDFNAFTRL